MRDIPGYESFQAIEPVEKGWSNDRKYKITTLSQEQLLLRLSPIDEYEKKLAEYDIIEQTSHLGFLQSMPRGFGTCCEGRNAYALLTWIEGEEASEALPNLSVRRQYELGVAAGNILRKIHSIPAPASQEPWEARYNRKLDSKIRMYQESPIKVDGGDAMMAYAEGNRHLIKNRPQTLHHGDYHVGNMIVTPRGELGIIDYNRFDYGDPWEEFNRITWCAQSSPAFASGRIDGYFDGEIPALFFRLLALYILSNMLSSIPWAIPFGNAEVDTMTRQAADVLAWYDGMKNPVPTWYRQWE